MKLSLLDSRKVQTFLFSTFLFKKVSAGKWFSDCLTYDTFPDYVNNKNLDGSRLYNSLINFPFAANNMNNGTLLNLCCDNYQCVLDNYKYSCSSIGTIDFSCAEIDQTIFCYSDSSSCGGIIGSSLVTNNYSIGSCPATSELAKNLTGVDIEDGNDVISEFCPLDSCTHFPNDGVGLYCYWDNDIWTCYIHTGDLIDNNSRLSCIMQLKGPLPVNKNFVPPVSTSSANLDLTKKIIAPIGTVVGVSLTGGLVYYIIRIKKKLQQKEKELLKKREEVIKLSHLNKQKNQTGTSNLVNEEEIINQLVINDEQLNNEIVEQQQSYIEIS